MAEHRIIPRGEWDPLHRGGWPWYAGGKPSRPMPATEAWAHYPGGGNIPPETATFEEDAAFVQFLDRVGYARFGPSTGTGWGTDELGPYGAGISYSLVITKAGRIFRGHDPRRQSSHTAGHNVEGMGYCFLVADGEDLTDAQVEAAAWALQEQVRLGELTHARLDGGHRDVYPTICPTDRVMAAIPQINALAAAGGTMSLPRNDGTPAATARLETALRRGYPGIDIYCAPSMAGRQCVRGKHGHLWDPKNRKVSTHYVDAAGGWSGAHVGGAIDAGFDPPSGAGISDYEKVRLDDLVADLDKLGWGCIWGVPQHYDHAHIDYVRANRNIVYQGPNAGFRVAEIEAVQRAAKALGVYAGEVDGVRGVGTQTAIRTLQKLAGVTVDGLPGKTTMARVLSFLELNAGFTLAQIRAVQTDLTKLRLYSGTVDGLRGAATEDAIKTVQRRAGLVVDGLPGAKTQAAIRAALADLDKPAPTPEPEPDPGPTLAEKVAPYRVAGPDAYTTAIALAEWSPTGPGTVLLAVRGSVDYASAAAAAARAGAAVLPLPAGGTVPTSIRDHLARTRPTVVIVGGPGAIPDTTAADAIRAAGHTL